MSIASGQLARAAEVTAQLATKTNQADFLALMASVALNAPLASPVFTGNPTGPTRPAGDNSMSLATTAFVAAAIAALIGGAPGTLDTLNEIATALGDDPNLSATLTTAIAGKLAKSANLSDLANVATARANLGLGTAALLAYGIAAGNLVRLDPVTGKLPAVDGSQLTNLPAALVSSVFGRTGAVTLAASDISTALGFNPRDVADIGCTAKNVAPTGCLECNGAAISRTTYAALFAAISTTFGAGDGSTTFNIPDLRGYFIRGWDHGAGRDSGRAIGTSQADAIIDHGHTSNLRSDFAIGGSSPALRGTLAGSVSGTDTVGPVAGATAAAETRPKNVALLFYIKY